MEELKEKIREYERSLISDLEKINEQKDVYDLINLGSLCEMETVTNGQLHACGKILKMFKK